MSFRRLLPHAVLICLLSLFVAAKVQNHTTSVSIEQFMTPEEQKSSGVMTLSPVQRAALTAWLRRYTEKVVQATQNGDIAAPPKKATSASICSPAIESNISGDFEGWDGETIFKLDNAQIWQQAEYAYTYSYSYRPEVTIYQTSDGCRMKVEDEDETILVKRLK